MPVHIVKLGIWLLCIIPYHWLKLPKITECRNEWVNSQNWEKGALEWAIRKMRERCIRSAKKAKCISARMLRALKKSNETQWLNSVSCVKTLPWDVSSDFETIWQKITVFFYLQSISQIMINSIILLVAKTIFHNNS